MFEQREKQIKDLQNRLGGGGGGGSGEEGGSGADDIPAGGTAAHPQGDKSMAKSNAGGPAKSDKGGPSGSGSYSYSEMQKAAPPSSSDGLTDSPFSSPEFAEQPHVHFDEPAMQASTQFLAETAVSRLAVFFRSVKMLHVVYELQESK